MSAETLFVAATNDRSEWALIRRAVDQLRRTIDHTANRVAKENADWHDDPSADDHAAFHAPSLQQFPREMRDEAIIDLVRHYLTETTLAQGS